MKSFGEYIHGHHGEYKNWGYGNASDNDVKIFFRNGKVGDADSCNQMLILGSCKETAYMWSAFVSEKERADFAAGYEHVVYTDGTLEVLHDVRQLVDFPFMSAEECSAYMENPEKLNESERKAYFTGIQKKNNRKVELSKDLLFELACYCVDRIHVNEKRFLCVLVPADERDYQGYCRSVINQILEVIPVGLRSNFCIATNPSPDTEKEFGIVFKRDCEILPPNAIRINGYFDRAFLRKLFSFKKEMKDFLWNCVNESEWIEECYKNMELAINDPIKLSDTYGYYLDYYKGIGSNIVEEVPETKFGCDEEYIKSLVSELGEYPKASEIEELFNAFPDESCDRINKLVLTVYIYISEVFEKWRKNRLQSREPSSVCRKIIILEKVVSEKIKSIDLNIPERIIILFDKNFDQCLTEYLLRWIKKDFKVESLKEAFKLSEKIKCKKNRCIFRIEVYNILLDRFDRSVIEKNKIDDIYKVLEEVGSVPDKLTVWYENNMNEEKNRELFDRLVEKTRTVDQYIYYLRKKEKLLARLPDGKKEFENQFLKKTGSRCVDFHLFLSAISYMEDGFFENLEKENTGIFQLYVAMFETFYKNKKIGVYLQRGCDLMEVYHTVLIYEKFAEKVCAKNIFLISNRKKKRFRINVVKENIRMLVNLQKGYSVNVENKKTDKLDPEFVKFMRNAGALPLNIYGKSGGIAKSFPDLILGLLFSRTKTEIMAGFCVVMFFGCMIFAHLPTGDTVHQKKYSRGHYVQTLVLGNAKPKTNVGKANNMYEIVEPDDDVKKLIKIASDVWDKKEYKDAFGIFETIEILSLIYTIENSDDSSNIQSIYEYLTLHLLQNNQDDSFTSVNYYDMENVKGAEQLTETSPVVIIGNYTTEAENKTKIYCYEKENDDYVNFVSDNSEFDEELVASLGSGENLLYSAGTEKVKEILANVMENTDMDEDFQVLIPKKHIFSVYTQFLKSLEYMEPYSFLW